MQNILSGLRLDHELIFKRLEKLKEMWLNLDAKEEAGLNSFFSELCHFQKFMEVHHEIEEQFLFPALKPFFKQIQSGPHCSMYMMQQIIEPPLSRAREWSHFFQEELPLNQTRMDEIERHVQIGSYLSIPLEEHEAGAAYFGLLRKLLGPSAKTVPNGELMLAIHSYLSLIHSHASKEDQCLFPQCEGLLASTMVPIAIEVPELTRRKWEAERRAFSIGK